MGPSPLLLRLGPHLSHQPLQSGRIRDTEGSTAGARARQPPPVDLLIALRYISVSTPANQSLQNMWGWHVPRAQRPAAAAAWRRQKASGQRR